MKNLSSAELEKELKARKAKAEKEAAALEKARKEAEKREYVEKFGALEKAFLEASEKCREELKEAKALKAKAEKMAIDIAEKYKTQISWGEGYYTPKSVEDWKTENLTDEQLEFIDGWLDDTPNEGPGEWWYPSRYC